MKKILVTSLSLLSLTACSLAPGGSQIEQAVFTAVETGIEDRKAYNDKKAATILEAACDITVGAYYRIGNTTKQEAIAMLCSGQRPREPLPSLVDTIPLP